MHSGGKIGKKGTHSYNNNLNSLPHLSLVGSTEFSQFESKTTTGPKMAAVSSLFNGERAVVVLFLGCVLHSLPPSLRSHGVVLSLLAFFSLSVEILLEPSLPSLFPFKTRPGASSGILLGAVTLPAVMLSKLVQLARAFSLNVIDLEELNYADVQYWATSASCFGVLVFLLLIVWHSSNTSSPRTFWGAKFGLNCLASCVILLLLSYSGMDTSMKSLWVLFHGFAAVQLVQHLLNTFPSCASIGEALLVTAGLILYFGDMLACTIAKLHGFVASSEVVFVKYGIRRSEISVIIQGLLLGPLLFPIIFKFVVRLWDCFSSSTTNLRMGAANYNEKWRSLIFVASLGFTMTGFVPAWMQLVQDFQVHPLLWVVMFIFSEPVKRLSLCMYWVCIICVGVWRFYSISKHSKIERILLRKYYHLMAVLMFLPAVIFQPKFLDLAFGVALAIFLTLEIIRVWRIWPLGQLVHQFMNAFTDHRDSDLLIVSHFSLLLGCAIPIWMSSGYNDRPLASFAGILSLGIGDTMASMVGYKYGVLRWSKTGKKTIEGTAAGITSVLACCSVLLPILASTGYILTQHWVSLLLAIIVSGLLEASTSQLDNAFIPLVFYSLLCL